MENKPKKSKAFIITFIIVMVLLLIAYFLFKNKDQVFGTKSGNTSRIFAPLFGSSKQKPSDTINNESNGTTTPDGTNSNSGADGQTNNTSSVAQNSFDSESDLNGTTKLGSNSSLGSEGFGSTGNLGVTNGFGTTPPIITIPTPGDNTNNQNWTGPTIITPPNDTPTDTPTLGGQPAGSSNLCLNAPLIFTDNEKTQLDDLLKEYYLLAPKLKNADDIALIDNDVSINQGLIDQADDLTRQCTTQKRSLSYAGPQTVKDNPYYTNNTSSFSGYYLQAFSQLEKLFNIW